MSCATTPTTSASRGKRERRAQPLARRGVGAISLRVDAARDQHDALARDTGVDELPLDRARQRNDGAIRTVLESRERGRLRRVDAPREHGRESGERRRETAVEIGAAARVHVHEVGLETLQLAREPRQQRDVELAAHRQRAHERGRGRGAELAARRAEQQVLDAAARQSFEQVSDLGRAAVEMPAGLDVRDSHASIIRGPASSTCASAYWRQRPRRRTSSERTISVIR